MADGESSPRMVERVFVGWDRPFLERAADWLLERRDELPGMLVVVPTAQGGRRLRKALAERAGAILSPTFTTPGALMKAATQSAAADWMERVAWAEVLDAISDWADYQELFPQAPEAGGGWEAGFVGEMATLRRALQESGHTLGTAARALATSVESGRWEALARLEFQVERQLHAWGMQSRSKILAGGLQLPATRCLVLAGVTEMPQIVERAIMAREKPVAVLIGAPPDESDAFSPSGKPLAPWTERHLPWPDGCHGSVRLAADARQQAAEALAAVCEAGTPSGHVALGSADEDTGEALAQVFTRAGWPAYHPAAKPAVGGLARWLRTWSSWLVDPRLAVMMELLALPETVALVPGNRAALAENLSRLRNDWMATRPEDLRHHMALARFRSDAARDAATRVLAAAESLEQWRALFLRGDFPASMARLLETMRKHLPGDAAANGIDDWLAEAQPVLARVKRPPGFWLDLLLSDLGRQAPPPPDGRVIDVQGWLELFLEPGPHLVICGMNEGSVPAREAADPWLGEAARTRLGLPTRDGRAARDAFLYHAMLEARRGHGRVDLVCAKTGPGGEALLPSRLLLAAPPDELPERVKFLFRGIEPPEAGLRWHADWKWQPPAAAIPRRLNATSFADYLACPFRFYLKHAAALGKTEPDRAEWNARDYGNVAHEVLERWGRDTEARDFSKAGALHDWLAAELERVLAERFGRRMPLAVRIQAASLRQRFEWLARVQASHRAAGWQVAEVEHGFEIPAGAATIAAKIDRIDRHAETGSLRVIDYKTGSVAGVAKAHRRKITSRTTLPAHLAGDGPAIYTGEESGKPSEFRWVNLQLPLYALAIRNRDGILPVPCYFTIGSSAADVALQAWEDFSEADLDAAWRCADWIAASISSGDFWPPAEKVEYDDYAKLAAGRHMEEMFSPAASGQS